MDELRNKAQTNDCERGKTSVVLRTEEMGGRKKKECCCYEG